MRSRRILTLIAMGLLFLTAGSPSASELRDSFNSKSQIGISLGAWSHQGDKIPETFAFSSGFFESKVNRNSFYFEGYYAHRLMKHLLAEFSVGVANRGSVTIEDGGVTDVGNLMVYPILVSARIYPFATLDSRLQPFLLAGGGLYYGRQTVQFTTDYYDPSYRERSATDFDFAFGGGFDWLLSPSLGLELKTRYSPIHFAKPLLTAKEYDSFAITVGIKYFYMPKKEKR